MKRRTNMNNLEPSPLGQPSIKLKRSPSRRRQEDEMRVFFANKFSMLCIAGFDGCFKRLNPGWESTLGWRVEQLQGKPLVEFVHPDDRPVLLVDVNGLVRRGRTSRFENRYRCKDGSYKWLEWTATSLPARRQIYAIVRDATLGRALESEVLERTDREKERLGRELHDGLCQNLAGIAALSTTLSRKLAADSNPAAVEAGDITRLLNETISHTHEMARGLNLLNLKQIGLPAALDTFSSNVHAQFQVSCTFRCQSPFLELDSEVGMHLYRIVQEAVNNAITHGRCSRIEISLGVRGRTGRLTIQDDGLGIPQNATTSRGVGLQTMDYRSRLIGGALQVRGRTRRGGTAVTCLFPLPPKLPKD